MHYKNGREAKNGDKVVLIPAYGYPASTPVVGILYDAVAGNDHCNGKLAPVAQSDPCPNLKECLHLEDVLAALPAKVRDVTAPVNDSDSAKIAYDAYRAATGGVSLISGDKLPEFDQLKPEIREAWYSAAAAAIASTAIVGTNCVSPAPQNS